MKLIIQLPLVLLPSQLQVTLIQAALLPLVHMLLEVSQLALGILGLGIRQERV